MTTTDHIEVNEPPRTWALPKARELWDHRELVYHLGRRDLAVRYKQTVVGALWAVLQPVLLAAVFSVFLGLLARVPGPAGVPYPVFALAGMTMWFFFATGITRSSESTVSSVDLISKVYFPRLVIPLAALIQPAVDFVIAFFVLLVVMAAYGVAPQVNVLLAPAMFLLAAGLAFGIGLWLSALVVRYRDIRHIVPFLIQTGLFVTPVVYTLNLIPTQYRALYALNPLVAVLEGWRWALLPGANPPGLLLLVPITTGALLIVTGLLYFKRVEASFADVI